MEEMEGLAKKEIDKIEKISKNLKMINSDGAELFNLFQSYFIDAKHFFQKKQFVQAFEAAVICWAYADAGLHLKVFEVDEELKKFFTID